MTAGGAISMLDSETPSATSASRKKPEKEIRGIRVLVAIILGSGALANGADFGTGFREVKS